MAISKPKQPQDYQEHDQEEHYSAESGGSDPHNDHSDTDPTYSIIQETRSKVSRLSIKKKSKSRVAKDLDASFEQDSEEVEKKSAEVDEKSYGEVQKIIQAGKLEILKVEQCKVYLRKNELRLTGKKDTLIQRIKEHQEILNGGGEEKYPTSSFVLDCKGDACRGDVVMFEQNVYDQNYNVASRSAGGPPCGTRTVAGRIVMERYGAAKQQHTFTIEVLWSKGEKPHSALHPLKIKGRNLYRLRTLRQRWDDEGERRRVMLEKHSRGSLARSNRETRIQEKERRKMLREKRALKKEGTKKSHSQLNPKLKTSMGIQGQLSSSSVNVGTTASQPQQRGLSVDSGTLATRTNKSAANGVGAEKQEIQTQHSGLSILSVLPQQPEIRTQNSESIVDRATVASGPQQMFLQPQQSNMLSDSAKPILHIAFALESRKRGLPPDLQKNQKENQGQFSHHSVNCSGIQDVQSHKSVDFGSQSSNFYDHHSHFNKYPCTSLKDGLSERDQRQPLESVDYYRPMSSPHRQGCAQPKLHAEDNYHRQGNSVKYNDIQDVEQYRRDDFCSRSPNFYRKPLTSIHNPVRSPHRQGYQQPKLQKNGRENDYHNQVPHNSVKYSGSQDVKQQRSDDFGSRSPNFYMNDGSSRFNKHPCTSWKDRNNHTVSSNHYRPMSPPPQHRKPLTSMNPSRLMRSPIREGYQQVQLCRYFAQGRCHYGDNCKFLHELREERNQRREERWPTSPRRLEGRPYLF